MSTQFQNANKIKFMPLPYIGMFDLDVIYQSSDAELLYHVLYKLNEIAKSQNIIIDNFQKVIEWATEQIEKFTKEQLEEWLNDGTITDIILQLGQVIKVYDTTVDMLKDTSVVKGLICKTLGYSKINDGGQSLFIVSDIADNAFFQFYSNGLYFNLLENNQISIKQVTDNFDDIGATVNNLFNVVDIVYIPEGEYQQTTTINVSGKKQLVGENINTLVLFKGDGTCINIQYPSDNATVKNIKFQNMNSCNEFSYLATGLIINPTQNGNGIIGTIIDRVQFFGFKKGIVTYFCWCCSFYDVRVNTTRKPLELNAQTNNILFNNCHFLCIEQNNDSNVVSSFINCLGITFNGCEFANGFSCSTYGSTLLFLGCYIEYIDNPFISVSGSSENYVSIISPYILDGDYINFNDVNSISNFSGYIRNFTCNLTAFKSFEKLYVTKKANDNFLYRLNYDKQYTALYNFIDNELVINYLESEPYVTLIDNISIPINTYIYTRIIKKLPSNFALQFYNTNNAVVHTIDSTTQLDGFVALKTKDVITSIKIWFYQYEPINIEDIIISTNKEDLNERTVYNTPVVNNLPTNGANQIIKYNNSIYYWNGSAWVAL